MRGNPATKMVLSTWGARVKAARKRLDLSQVAAAERVGIDQGALSKIERGEYRAMSPALVLRLCVGLNMDPHADFTWPASIVEFAKLSEAAA